MSVMNVQVYDLVDSNFSILPTEASRRQMDEQMETYIADNFARRHPGWTNSYVPQAAHVLVSPEGIEIVANYSRYADHVGMLRAIQEGKSFAPTHSRGLAVATFAISADRKLILPRRSEKVDVPFLYNTPCGWMSSMNIAPRDVCEDPQYAADARLYDPKWQAVKECMEETGLLPIAEFQIDHKPNSISIGFMHSFNISLNYHVSLRVSADRAIMLALRDQEEFVEGSKEHDMIRAVPVDQIEQLIRNQPELQQEDPASFEPSDVTELILVDHTLAGLVHGFYRLTSQQMPRDLIDHLQKGGIDYQCQGARAFTP